MKRGIVLAKADEIIEARAVKFKLPITVDAERPFAYGKTLFVEPGSQVPWDLLPAAWHFLERWDAAVPLWRYGTTAADIGTKEERKATGAIVRDLRVLLHSWELLFVHRNEAGMALIETWKEEYAGGGDKRLAFLRALYTVKPRLCVLPTSWLADVNHQSKQAAMRGGRVMPAQGMGKPLVMIELEPGRFVKCQQGDEDAVRASFEQGRR